MFHCDTARISCPTGETLFLIIGRRRSTQQDAGAWFDERGVHLDFDYVQEQVIASGHTEKELIASAKHYKMLQGMTWEDYFRKLLEGVDVLSGTCNASSMSGLQCPQP